MRGLARRRPVAQPRVFSAAGIELNPLHHTATRHGWPLGLSSKEFAVLESLLRVGDEVLSAEELFAQVRDEHADPFTNTVHVTISRLRRKLGEPPAIETITNVGYRIIDHTGTAGRLSLESRKPDNPLRPTTYPDSPAPQAPRPSQLKQEAERSNRSREISKARPGAQPIGHLLLAQTRPSPCHRPVARPDVGLVDLLSVRGVYDHRGATRPAGRPAFVRREVFRPNRGAPR